MFGDHLGDVQGGPANWAQSLEACKTFVQQVKDAGGDAEMMYLPQMGIKGNSHMLMQDRNNLQLADLIVNWIDKARRKEERRCEPRAGAVRRHALNVVAVIAAVTRVPLATPVSLPKPRKRPRTRPPSSRATASPATTSG